MFTDDFPVNLFEADLIGFPLVPTQSKRPAMRRNSVAQSWDGMLKLTPGPDRRAPSADSIHVRSSEALCVLHLADDKGSVGFVPQPAEDQRR